MLTTRHRLPFLLSRMPDPRRPDASPFVARSIRYVARLWSHSDHCDGFDSTSEGEYLGSNEARFMGRMVVPIVSPYGTPAAGAMGHVYVADLNGRFLGLVAVKCLDPLPRRALEAARLLRSHNPGADIVGIVYPHGKGYEVGLGNNLEALALDIRKC